MCPSFRDGVYIVFCIAVFFCSQAVIGSTSSLPSSRASWTSERETPLYSAFPRELFWCNGAWRPSYIVSLTFSFPNLEESSAEGTDSHSEDTSTNEEEDRPAKERSRDSKSAPRVKLGELKATYTTLCRNGRPQEWVPGIVSRNREESGTAMGSPEKNESGDDAEQALFPNGENRDWIDVGDVFSDPAMRTRVPTQLPWQCVDIEETYVVLYYCSECESLIGVVSLHDVLYVESEALARGIAELLNRTLTYVFVPDQWVTAESVRQAIAITNAKHAVFPFLTNNVFEVVKGLPEFNFTILYPNADLPSDVANAEVLVYNLRGMGFEAGALAGLITKTGLVCTSSGDVLSEAALGVHAGVRHHCPTCRIVNTFVSSASYEVPGHLNMTHFGPLIRDCDVMVVVDRHLWTPLAEALADPSLPEEDPLRNMYIISVVRELSPQSEDFPRIVDSVVPHSQSTVGGLLANALGQFSSGRRYQGYQWTGRGVGTLPVMIKEQFEYTQLLYRIGALSPVYGALEVARANSPSPLFTEIAASAVGGATQLDPSWEDDPITCDFESRALLIAGDFSHAFVYSIRMNENTIVRNISLYQQRVGDVVDFVPIKEPLPFRRGATCTGLGDSSAVIHGGRTLDGTVVNETFLVSFDYVLKCRTKPCAYCTIPRIVRLPLETESAQLVAPPRYGHAALLTAEEVYPITTTAEGIQNGSPRLARPSFSRAQEASGDAKEVGYKICFFGGWGAKGEFVSAVSCLYVTGIVHHEVNTEAFWALENIWVAAPPQTSTTEEASAKRLIRTTTPSNARQVGTGDDVTTKDAIDARVEVTLVDGATAVFRPSFIGYMEDMDTPVAYDAVSGHVYALVQASTEGDRSPARVCGGVSTSRKPASNEGCYFWSRISTMALEGAACVTVVSTRKLLTAMVSGAQGEIYLYRYRSSTGTWTAGDELLKEAVHHTTQGDELSTLPFSMESKPSMSPSLQPRTCMGLPFSNAMAGGMFLFPSKGNSLADLKLMEVTSQHVVCGPNQMLSWDFHGCQYCPVGAELANDGFCQARIEPTSALGRLLPLITVLSSMGLLTLLVIAGCLCFRFCCRPAKHDLMWDRACDPRNAPPSGQSPIAAVRIAPSYFQKGLADRWPLTGCHTSSCPLTEDSAENDEDSRVGGCVDDFKVAVDVFSEHVCAAMEAHKCFLIRFTGDTAMFVGKDSNGVLAAATELSMALASLDMFKTHTCEPTRRQAARGFSLLRLLQGSDDGSTGYHHRSESADMPKTEGNRTRAMPIKVGLHHAFVARTPARKTTRFIYSGALAEECAKLMMASRPGVMVASQAFYDCVDPTTFHGLGVHTGDSYDLPLACAGMNMATMMAQLRQRSRHSSAHPVTSALTTTAGATTGVLGRTQVRDLVVRMVEVRFRDYEWGGAKAAGVGYGALSRSRRMARLRSAGLGSSKDGDGGAPSRNTVGLSAQAAPSQDGRLSKSGLRPGRRVLWMDEALAAGAGQAGTQTSPTEAALATPSAVEGPRALAPDGVHMIDGEMVSSADKGNTEEAIGGEGDTLWPLDRGVTRAGARERGSQEAANEFSLDLLSATTGPNLEEGEEDARATPAPLSSGSGPGEGGATADMSDVLNDALSSRRDRETPALSQANALTSTQSEPSSQNPLQWRHQRSRGRNATSGELGRSTKSVSFSLPNLGLHQLQFFAREGSWHDATTALTVTVLNERTHQLQQEDVAGAIVLELATSMIRCILCRTDQTAVEKRTSAIVRERFQLPHMTERHRSKPYTARALAARLVAVADVKEALIALQAAARQADVTMSTRSLFDGPNAGGGAAASSWGVTGGNLAATAGSTSTTQTSTSALWGTLGAAERQDLLTGSHRSRPFESTSSMTPPPPAPKWPAVASPTSPSMPLPQLPTLLPLQRASGASRFSGAYSASGTRTTVPPSDKSCFSPLEHLIQSHPLASEESLTSAGSVSGLAMSPAAGFGMTGGGGWRGSQPFHLLRSSSDNSTSSAPLFTERGYARLSTSSSGDGFGLDWVRTPSPPITAEVRAGRGAASGGFKGLPPSLPPPPPPPNIRHIRLAKDVKTAGHVKPAFRNPAALTEERSAGGATPDRPSSPLPACEERPMLAMPHMRLSKQCQEGDEADDSESTSSVAVGDHIGCSAHASGVAR